VIKFDCDVFPGVNGFSEYSGCSYKGGAVMGQWADICAHTPRVIETSPLSSS
jgi:hypothetical protein